MKQARAVVIVLLLVPMAQGFGYADTGAHAKVQPGGEAVFNTFFYGNDSVRFLGAEIPEAWNISVTPEEIVLPPEQPDTHLRTRDGYTPAKTVGIRVSVPEGEKNGVYAVKTRFAEKNLDSHDVAVAQVQSPTFRVEISDGVERSPETSRSNSSDMLTWKLPWSSREKNAPVSGGIELIHVNILVILLAWTGIGFYIYRRRF